MPGELLLAIDIGTQSARALLFDLRGNQVARSQIPIDPYVSPQPGWAEQDPALYWETLCQACQQLWSMPGVSPESVAGVGLTTQRATIVNVDRTGKPLRPALVWLDQRRAEGLKPIGGLWGLLFALAGLRETVAYFQAEAEVNWLLRYQPEIMEQTYKYVFLSGYLTYRLTGQFVDSSGCQVGYVPFDYKGKAWASLSDWKWLAAPVEPDQLPDLIPPAALLG